MKKRKPFFIKGNFQLRFLLCFVAVLATGIFFVTFLIYRSLKDIVEEAAFSSHLTFYSSGELFRRVIFDANLFVAIVSVFIALLFMAGAYLFLQNFFRSLAEGLDRLARGDFSFRLKVKGGPRCRELLNDFNAAATALDKKAEETKASLDDSIAGIAAIESGWQEMLQEIKSIQNKLRQIS